MRHVLLIGLLASSLCAQQVPPPPHYELLAAYRTRGSLQSGGQGAEVAALQWALAYLGYDVEPDGEFGGQTRAAVESFQTAEGLAADGVVGPRTVLALDAHFGAASGDGRTSTSGRELKAALRSGERGRVHACLGALAALDEPKAVDAIEKRFAALLDHESSYRVCRQVLIGLQNPEARARVARLVERGDDVLARILALEVLEAWDREEDDKLVLEALDDGSAAVRRRAILALRKRRRVAVVYALIAHMKDRDNDRDAEHQQAAAALDTLVGQRLGLGADYEAWFDGDLDDPGGPLPRAGVEGTVSFYDTSLVSPSLVFLFDTSCSMRGRGYLEPAKQELQRTLLSLPAGTLFNVITFATEACPWQPRLVRAGERSQQAAAEHVAGLGVEGDRTRLDRALSQALACEGVDTIVILTDGFPEKSQPIPDCVMLDLLEEHNRTRQVRIVTLGFAQANHELMEAIAARTGGEHRQLE